MVSSNFFPRSLDFTSLLYLGPKVVLSLRFFPRKPKTFTKAAQTKRHGETGKPLDFWSGQILLATSRGLKPQKACSFLEGKSLYFREIHVGEISKFGQIDGLGLAEDIAAERGLLKPIYNNNHHNIKPSGKPSNLQVFPSPQGFDWVIGIHNVHERKLKVTPLETDMTWENLPFSVRKTSAHSWWMFQPVMLVFGGKHPSWFLWNFLRNFSRHFEENHLGEDFLREAPKKKSKSDMLMGSGIKILLMEEILRHLGCIPNPCK